MTILHESDEIFEKKCGIAHVWIHEEVEQLMRRVVELGPGLLSFEQIPIFSFKEASQNAHFGPHFDVLHLGVASVVHSSLKRNPKI